MALALPNVLLVIIPLERGVKLCSFFLPPSSCVFTWSPFAVWHEPPPPCLWSCLNTSLLIICSLFSFSFSFFSSCFFSFSTLSCPSHVLVSYPDSFSASFYSPSIFTNSALWAKLTSSRDVRLLLFFFCPLPMQFFCEVALVRACLVRGLVRSRSRVEPWKRGCVLEFDLDLDLDIDLDLD